jgi:hypothetical protein
MKEGDIVVCSTDMMYGQKYQLIVGDQHIINNIIRMTYFEKTIIDVTHKKTNKRCLFDQSNFITLEVWREFQLRKVLE